MKRWILKLLKNRRAMLGLIAAACCIFTLIPYFLLWIAPAAHYYLPDLAEDFDFQVPFLPKMESELINLRIREGKKAPADPRLVYLSVNPQSVIGDTANDDEIAGSPALKAMSNSWPWPRSVYGHILDRLAGAGAKAVIFDFLFPKPGPGDDIFKKAASKYRNQVILKSNFSDFEIGDGTKRLVLGFPSESVTGETDKEDPRLAYANYWPDPDGVIRRAIYCITLSQANRNPALEGEQIYYSTAGRVAKNLEHEDVAQHGPGKSFLFRYAGFPDHSFPTRPVYEIFIPKFWNSPDMFDRGNYFKDKIVIVGPFGNYFKDFVSTPLGTMNGAELHLHALNALLNHHFLQDSTFLQEVGLIIASAFAAWLLVFLIHSPAWRCFAGLIISVLFFYSLQILYDHFDILVNATAAPLIAFNSTNLFGLTYEFILERIEKARVRSTFERYVSRNVVREILDSREDYQNLLGGKRKPVTILFSDIRGFTTMTENADAEALVERLNEYLSAMVKCVYSTDGTLDKFIGDAVMAVWGNVLSMGPAKDGEHAIDTALEMLQELRRMNEAWTASGQNRWDIGIGLNHGEVIVGNMGATEKMEFTVIGDPVNLASRLESLTKEYGLELIIGESLAALVKDKYYLQSVDLVTVKGKTKPVEVFAVLGKLPEPLPKNIAQYHSAFEEGIRLFRAQKFTEALEKFTESELAKPGDYLSIRVYQPRCVELAANPPGEGWDGVHRMTKK